MLDRLSIRSLSPADFPELYRAFIAAFADYQTPMHPSQDELRQRFQRVSLHYKLSAGAFDGDKMVSFILTGKGGFSGQPTAYNAGTGTLPEWRKSGLAKRIYEYLIPMFRKHGIGQCLLEVMTNNQAAYQLYEGLGFEKSRLLRCYAANVQWIPSQQKIGLDIQISESQEIDWELYEMLGDVRPSWQNKPAAISHSLHDEIVLEAYYQTGLVGYAIFNPQNGRVSQIAVEKGFRNQGIGSLLLVRMQSLASKRLTILNIDDTHRDTCQFFSNRGFINLINQWEMILPI